MQICHIFAYPKIKAIGEAMDCRMIQSLTPRPQPVDKSNSFAIILLWQD